MAREIQWRFRSAASEGRTLTVLKCLESGAVANARDVYGQTALHLSCRDGKMDTAILLLAHGANLDLVGIDGRSALMWASRYGHLDVCLMLLSCGADASLQDNSSARWLDKFGEDRWAPLMSATQKRDIVAAAMSAFAADDSPLHTASRFSCLELCLIFISRGADPSLKNDRQETALELYGAGRLVQNLSALSRAKRLQAASKMTTARAAFIKKSNWLRRRDFVHFLVGSGYRSLEKKKTPQSPLQHDLSAHIDGVDISTPEKLLQFLIGLVYSNEGLVRRIGAFL